jgi:hypothetical protein
MTRAHARLLGPCFKTGRVDVRPFASDLGTMRKYTSGKWRKHKLTRENIQTLQTQKHITRLRWYYVQDRHERINNNLLVRTRSEVPS